MPVAADQFKAFMRQFPSGVTVVTYRDGAVYGGLAVSSFCSLSLSPPLVLVCIDKRIRSNEGLRAAGAFGVNICRKGQTEVVSKFADSTVDRHALILSLRHRISPLGAPLLDDALAGFECKIVQAHDGGDHTIFVGQVESGEVDADGEAMVYYRSRFGGFSAG